MKLKATLMLNKLLKINNQLKAVSHLNLKNLYLLLSTQQIFKQLFNKLRKILPL